MRKVLPLVIVGLILAGVAASFLTGSQQGQLRDCGHPRDLWSEMSPIRATHCCTSGRTVNQLAMLYCAQGLYRQNHGAYATTFEQLTNKFFRRPGDYEFYLESDGSRWSVAVPQQATLAGSYLLTDDGKLHFSTSGAATINDIVLIDLTR